MVAYASRDRQRGRQHGRRLVAYQSSSWSMGERCYNALVGKRCGIAMLWVGAAGLSKDQICIKKTVKIALEKSRPAHHSLSSDRV